MTTLRDIARRALLKIGAINPRMEPSDREAQDVIDALQAWMLQSPAIGLAGDFTEVEVAEDEDYTAKENERVRITTTANVNVTLPEDIQLTDGGDDYGDTDIPSTGSPDNTRPPKNGARVQIMGVRTSEETDEDEEFNELWIYVRSLGNWVELTDLELSSENPLGSEFDGPLAAIAAELVAPNYGQQLLPSVQREVQRARALLASSFDDQGKTNPKHY